MASGLRAALLSILVALVASLITERIRAQSSASSWKTLSGAEPLVIARGGMSGLLPDQTTPAYELALNNSLINAVMYCDIQLTKDQKGLCRTNLTLESSTNIQDIYPDREKSYLVDGSKLTGWFSIDFTSKELDSVKGRQTVSYRTTAFDDLDPVALVAEVSSMGPVPFWLNVERTKFYEQQNLSLSSYLLSTSKTTILNYISSSEVGFLRSIAKEFTGSKTKLILKFLDKEDIELSTNETYGSLLNDLRFVKTIASGILVPKDYIWPVDGDSFLEPHTSLVRDAHTTGLEVFAADFANDAYPTCYNYSFDPIREYLQFVDNADFAVDGFLTDFSVTASEAIACYAHNRNRASSSPGKPLIIAHNGASGDYPGCTDIAYEAAIKDGADYIGCSVQITKDGFLICRESPDLIISTTVASDSSFYPSHMTKVPDIQAEQGIFTFDLTWKEIQSLKPSIFSPYQDGANVTRSPAYAHAGKIVALTDFLELVKSQAKIGAFIKIQYARFLASERKLNVTDATISALKAAGYENMTERVRIQSEDSAVLVELRQRTNFKLVYEVTETDVTIPDSTIKQIKQFADIVTLSRGVIIPFDAVGPGDVFLLPITDVVRRMHRHNISVFVSRFRNEFTSLAFDYLADPTMEISTFVKIAEVDGLLTDFPATARAYLGNACLSPPKTDEDFIMTPVIPGELLGTIPGAEGPSAPPPGQPLTTVREPPLPSVTASGIPAPAPAPAPAPTSKGHVSNGATGSSVQPTSACPFIGSLLIGLLILVLN